MPAPTLERSLETVPLRDLHAHPDNTRGDLKASSLASLVESIKARGILTPLCVRPRTLGKPGFEILAGHRRLAAARELGLASVPCQVVTLDDDQARAVVLLENTEREDPDLFRQADLAARLVASRQGDVADVALLLGKPRHWVARMRAIAGIEPSVRKAMTSEKCDWTVQMVEYFAGLAHDVQKARWEEVRVEEDLASLKQAMGEDFHVLGQAPFDVADASLLPKAGACSTCPKTSARAPGLFDAEDLDPANPKALAKATCRDPICWASKCVARARVQIREVEERVGQAPVVIQDYGTDDATTKSLGVKTVRSWDLDKAKKGDRGAVPVVTFKSDNTVSSVSWAKPRGARVAAAVAPKKKAEKPKPPTEAQRLERFLQRRAAWIVDHVADLVRETKSPPPDLVRGLVCLFGCGLLSRQYSGDAIKPGKIPALLSQVLSDPAAWAARIWPHARLHCARQLERQNLDVVAEQSRDASAVYAVLMGITDAEACQILVGLAEKDLPTPKALEGALAEAQAHFSGGQDPSRRARRARGKAAAAGDTSTQE
jgi:ParB/RepB/Spo0J family partition protein